MPHAFVRRAARRLHTRCVVVDDFVSIERRSAPGEAGAELEPLSRGAIVGRYVIVDMLGAGAMGVVYAAYDPELMRQVALKMLRPREDLTTAAARVHREAQALAKLSHRNVVAVYDVGRDGERVYLAMELVRGSNLRGWLAARPRPWSEVLPVMLAAGHGLAAAHAHGLVHRDFKPENVIIGADDGRVCVTDFGLARPDPTRATGSTSGALAMTLTAGGDALGTPAYMAPEQHVGGIADARADQYAFCVALFEALYGERPFDGDHAAALSEAKHAGAVQPAERSKIADPSGRRWPVPARLRAIVRRGLAVDPADRFASMDELLDALARDPGARRRGVLAAAAGLLGLAAIVGLVASDREGPCAHAGVAPPGWDEDARAAIARSFEDSGLHYAGPLARWVVTSLDESADAWRREHQRSCAATWLRGEQSPELLDVRNVCLRRDWEELAAAARVLGAADAIAIAHAPTLIGELPRAEHCAQVELDRSALHDRELADARALQLAGHRAEAIARTDDLLAAAPGWGELLLLRAQLSDDEAAAHAQLQDALALAKPARDARLEAQIWIALARTVAAHDPAEASFYGELAIAAIDAAPRDDLLRAWAEASLGELANDPDRARTHFAAALALRRAALGDDHYLTGRAHEALARASTGAAAFEHATRAEAIYRATLGPEHPALDAITLHHARVLTQLGRHDEARVLLAPLRERGLAIDADLR